MSDGRGSSDRGVKLLVVYMDDNGRWYKQQYKRAKHLREGVPYH